MSFSEQLWNKYYTDALASLYNPFVLGLANGNLSKEAFVEYIQQDSFYLDVYEKAYLKAIELCHNAGLADYEKCFTELIKGIVDEKEKHLKRAAERGEKIEQPQILRATKGYTDLLTKAYTEGSLGDIVAAILPCTKLYDFIGHQIKKAIPDHHHTYSEWIDVYSSDDISASTASLEEMLNTLSATDDKKQNEFYYAEAMRLEFEFFNQQNHVFAAPTTGIFSVAAGSVCKGKEVVCDHQSAVADREGLSSFVSSLPATASETCECCKKWDERIREMGKDYGKTVVALADFEKKDEVTLGYGSFMELPQLLKTDLPVLVAPSASEIHAVESYGLKARRLLTAMVYSIDALPKDTVFFVEHVFEVGMALMGGAFYPNQHFDTLPTTLVIAGSDSGGGAGLQADMKACCALGAYSTTVLTALTAQNTQGAQHIFSIPVDWIEKQIDSVLQDIHVDCVKTGMLGTKEAAHLVAEKMKEYKIKTLVVDPCMICRSGNKIMAPDAVPVVKEELIPLALIITPNYFEACTLLGHPIPHTVEGLKAAAKELLSLGCKNVYLKGGRVDGSDEACDVLCYGDNGDIELFKVSYVQTRNTHGTGCTLASSIAAELARGLPVLEAVKAAKEYVNQGVIASRFLHVGKGKQGPLNHLYRTFPCEQH